MSKTGLIIRREYMERVGKKSFIITTILMPILMLALMAAPALIMNFWGSSKSSIVIIDHTGVLGQQLPDDTDIQFVIVGDNMTVKNALADETSTGVLVIPEGIIDSDKYPVTYYTKEASSLTLETALEQSLENAIRTERLKRHNIDDLDQILDEVNADVTLKTYKTDKDEDSVSESSTIISYALGMLMMLLLYMILLLYGQMVMTGIIEEKNNRVLELVVSSVSPTRLMMGKIIGVALVALTQIVIWMVLIALMSSLLLPAMIPADVMAEMTSMQAGTLDVSQSANNIDLLQALGMLTDVGYILMLFVYLLIFLVGGFLLFSSLYAAVGSAVDNIQDASQLQSIIVVPIFLAIIFSMMAAANPGSTLALVTSLIPFTSPMVMMVRIPFGVPAWEIIVSIAILYASTFVMIWLAAKIYRIGIFMYGKKPGFKDIIAWMRYK